MTEREYQQDFDNGADANAPRHALARNVAKRTLKEFGFSNPPVDVTAIIRRRGLTLVAEPVPGAASGQLFAAQREIVINTHEHSLARQRFTMAHELGHWELRHHLDDELPEDALGFEGAFGSADSASEGRSPVEIEANTFAAELLMPRAWLRRETRPLRVGRVDELAELYQVSREAMFYQVMRCGMLV